MLRRSAATGTLRHSIAVARHGFTQGREYAEMVWPLDVLFLIIFALLTINVWRTVARRTEKSIYISVWSFMIGPLLLISLV